jgi:hypothetical protein
VIIANKNSDYTYQIIQCHEVHQWALCAVLHLATAKLGANVFPPNTVSLLSTVGGNLGPNLSQNLTAKYTVFLGRPPQYRLLPINLGWRTTFVIKLFFHILLRIFASPKLF